ncbi:hypothetical protein ACEN9X_26995 [Mucilaginibacter sp. Mucisp86]|uniref:hypothetical protein n=1 Tax=Mucilaginibacter sp. Mucisp86 TaxID=3243060 RepID=UPI0039B3B163
MQPTKGKNEGDHFGEILVLETLAAVHKDRATVPAPVKKTAKARQSSLQLQLKRHLETDWLFGLAFLRKSKAMQASIPKTGLPWQSRGKSQYGVYQGSSYLISSGTVPNLQY